MAGPPSCSFCLKCRRITQKTNKTCPHGNGELKFIIVFVWQRYYRRWIRYPSEGHSWTGRLIHPYMQLRSCHFYPTDVWRTERSEGVPGLPARQCRSPVRHVFLAGTDTYSCRWHTPLLKPQSRLTFLYFFMEGNVKCLRH